MMKPDFDFFQASAAATYVFVRVHEFLAGLMQALQLFFCLLCYVDGHS